MVFLLLSFHYGENVESDYYSILRGTEMVFELCCSTLTMISTSCHTKALICLSRKYIIDHRIILKKCPQAVRSYFHYYFIFMRNPLERMRNDRLDFNSFSSFHKLYVWRFRSSEPYSNFAHSVAMVRRRSSITNNDVKTKWRYLLFLMKHFQ